MMQTAEFLILDWIQDNLRCDILDAVMPVLSVLVKAGILWIAVAVVLLILKKHRKCGLTLAASLAVTALICNVILKNLIARPRPVWLLPPADLLVQIPADHSFPSGHAAASFAAATVLMCYDKRFGIPALIFAFLVSFSRLYLYVHFPTDVIAGALIGFAVGMFFSRLIFKKGKTF